MKFRLVLATNGEDN